MSLDWVKEFPGKVTVSDPAGIILEMNDQAAEGYAAQGGRELIGTNMLDCHPEPARTKVAELLATRQTNVYTIEKHGAKKWVYQAPWYENGEFRGLVEFVLPVPAEIPHFVRK